MTETIIIISVIGIVTVFAAIIIHYRFKQAHFEMWTANFEEVYGETIPETDKNSIIRDIFNEGGMSIHRAIILYKEAKYPIELGEGIWKEITPGRTELMTYDQILERYDLTEEQMNELKERIKKLS